MVDDEKIICYINEDELKRNTLKKGFYNFQFDISYDWYDELEKYSYLNKPIYYIFEGITFDKSISISSKLKTLISVCFKDCVFTKGVWISDVQNVIFESNTCSDLDVFNVNNVKNLKFLNDNAVNCYEVKESKMDINFMADKIEMNNSWIKVNSYSNSEVNINGLNTIIRNSTVEGEFVYVSSYNLDIDNSSKLVGNRFVGVLSKNDNVSLENVDTPCYVNNEDDYESSNKRKK